MSFRNYYDSPSYGRSRNRTTSSTSTDRPTTVTAKYINPTPSYKSSNIPIPSDRSNKEETPISTIANRYSTYNKTEKPVATKYDSYSTNKSEKTVSKYEKKDYTKLTIPSITSASKSRDVSPAPTLKYNLSRPSRHISPERKTTKIFKDKTRDTSPMIRDKDIPSKTDKPTNYSSLSSYKLFPRTSNYTRPSSRTEIKGDIPGNNYTRPSSRTESKSEISLNSYTRPSSRVDKSESTVSNYTRSSTRVDTKPDTVISNFSRPSSRPEAKSELSVNRYAIANRLSSNYLRSPPVKGMSLSPVNFADSTKSEIENDGIPPTTKEESEPQKPITHENSDHISINDTPIQKSDNETETIIVITRHTSPTPPGSSAYVRTRRADMAKTIEKTLTRSKRKPEMADKEIQSDRLDDPTRSSRFGSTARTSMTNWSYYSPGSSNYTGYAGRYSTQYSNLRDSSGSNSLSACERSGRSHSREPEKDSNSTSLLEQNNKESGTDQASNNKAETNKETLSPDSNDQNKAEDTSEIMINVNLKLKRPKSSASTELVSPEITITNSQLPPQAPKTDGSVKTKKVKAKKTSSDSSSDSSSKKKTIKRRSKSVSSTDSEQSNDTNDRISGPKTTSKTSSNSNLQNGLPKLRLSKTRDSNSPESSITLSTQSSISEDENISKSKTNELSRTSADELSIPTDCSGKQPSPFRNENGAEEAKSFLIRALAPVTNLFKMRNQENSDNSRWPETSTSESTGKDVSNLTTDSGRSSIGKVNTTNIIASNDDNLVKLKAIRPIESGERAWWLDSETESKNNLHGNDSQTPPSEKNMSRKIKHVESGERAWWMESNEINSESKQESYTALNNKSSENINKIIKKCKFADEEKPWWLDSCANIPEGIERLSPPRKTSSDSDKSEKYNFFQVRRIESGDQKDWWLTSNDNSTNSSKLEQNHHISQNLSKSDSERNLPLRRIRHIESGERPWWLSSNKNIPEGVEKLPTPPPPDVSDSSDSEVQVYVPSTNIPPFPLHLPDDEPLGARRSPEGLETPKENEDYRGRASPYENNNQIKRRANSYQKRMNKYISRYSDIDDILGTSGQIYSPFMDSILARRTGHISFDDDVCEEIDPTQVRIHDSTAQRPVIKKISSRTNIIDYREEDQLDDATLQVFKDGDYGPYLDLDSTLGEQEEELEGLQDSRKNALVLRTQLSVRVHAIIEKLLHSQGRELRRALFTLKQILQSDKDLVHEFVANKGLDCLMQVANMADHNYLDYILRALGQILLYVDGMHGVMAHQRCIQWLYSLIASKYRHVVKTALKLLLVFVEYTEKNCLFLIDAIAMVDGSNGRLPWWNIMQILQDFDASDTELLIYATTLINRCLNNVPDRDTYYDQVDALQDQGIDEIIQLYMSKQGTDLDLLRQLQIFDAVLLYEDGDETGTSLKQLDDSVINSIRRRSININISERRRSKKIQAKEKGNQRYTSGLKQRIQNGTLGHSVNAVDAITAIRQKQLEINADTKDARAIHLNTEHNIKDTVQILNKPTTPTDEEKLLRPADISGFVSKAKKELAKSKSKVSENDLHWDEFKEGSLTPDVKDDRGILLNKENSIKDLAQRLTSPMSPTTEDKPLRASDMAGIVSKAKKELAKSQSKEIVKSPTKEISPKVHDIKISENDLHWKELKEGSLQRAFHLCDLDFSDLRDDSDDEMLSPTANSASGSPPPPPTMLPSMGMPPPMPGCFPPVPNNNVPVPPRSFNSELNNHSNNSTIKKNKKTVKLFWREIQENLTPLPIRPKVGGFIWDNLPDVSVDTNMLEHLFESRTNDLIIKEKLMEPKRNLILDAKRSNAINIAMKKLPKPQTIKAAIMKMDATVIGREGIEKLLTMLPTEEEKSKILEGQYSNPDLPLGSAEQFLLTLASVNELSSRLKLWVFKLDFDNLEKEIAEPLMDLKQGIELLKVNKTFKVILSTLRTVGNYLNGNYAKGFRLEYLSKVIEVKDTVHKHPLLYHICEMIIEKFPDSTDFFSEVGPVIRASKVDFDVLSANLLKLESDCKASWDHMKRIAKHDGSQIFKTKISEFLTDAAERIILLSVIKKRVMSRFNKFLLFLGVPPGDIHKTKPAEFLKVIAEFSLEYRTTRERVLQQLEKKANHRERNKTRGKMIIDVGNYSTKNGDHTADSALKELLTNDPDSLTEGRRVSQRINRKNLVNGDLSADDEILESLVRSVTSKPKPVVRERRRNRISDRKNYLNRTIDGNQS